MYLNAILFRVLYSLTSMEIVYNYISSNHIYNHAFKCFNSMFTFNQNNLKQRTISNSSHRASNIHSL